MLVLLDRVMSFIISILLCCLFLASIDQVSAGLAKILQALGGKNLIGFLTWTSTNIVGESV